MHLIEVSLRPAAGNRFHSCARLAQLIRGADEPQASLVSVTKRARGQSGDKTMVVPSEYLEVVATKSSPRGAVGTSKVAGESRT